MGCCRSHSTMKAKPSKAKPKAKKVAGKKKKK
jgi:hypothetical protein